MHTARGPNRLGVNPKILWIVVGLIYQLTEALHDVRECLVHILPKVKLFEIFPRRIEVHHGPIQRPVEFGLLSFDVIDRDRMTERRTRLAQVKFVPHLLLVGARWGRRWDQNLRLIWARW